MYRSINVAAGIPQKNIIHNNVTARIFDRQISTPRPGTSIHCARRFYENIFPNQTVYKIECPDHHICKFTMDGQYLISYSMNLRDLIVYRPKWFSFSYNGDESQSFQEFASRAQLFESFFNLVCSVSLASCNELICKDFFIYMESNRFGLFATTGGAVPGVPFIKQIKFHLLRLEDGQILDVKVFVNDAVYLAKNTGVVLYDDLLAIVSLRFQTIHVLQITDSGRFVHLRAFVTSCREYDRIYFNFFTQVQFLNRQHLLIELCSVDEGVPTLTVHNIEGSQETTQTVEFKRRTPGNLPINRQSRDPSPYFDLYLFRRDEKVVCANDRHEEIFDYVIDFILSRPPYSRRFTINSGPEADIDGQTGGLSTLLFHPFLPLALSIKEMIFLQPSIVSIHFRG